MTATMSDPRVKDRLERRFQRWDSDGSGSLERADFEREADQIAQRMGVDKNDPRARDLKSALVGMFHNIARDGGGNPQGISKKEYLRAAEKWIATDEEVLRQNLRPMVEAVVAMADQNRTGKIDRDEFVAWISAVGAGDGTAIDAFDRIDTNHTQDLSVDEVLQACVDFHLGKSEFQLL